MNSNIMNGQTVYFRTPALAADKRPPAAILSVSLTKSANEGDVLRFAIRRDLAVRVKSFTIRYRFSRVPVFKPDENSKFNAYVYDADDINTADIIEISAVIPSHMNVVDCGAYISERALVSGQVIKFDASEYRFMRKMPNASAPNAPTAPVKTVNPQGAKIERNVQQSPEKAFEKPILTEEEREERKGKRSAVILASILGVVLVVLVAEFVGGIMLYNYLGIKNSTDMLMNDGRYN